MSKALERLALAMDDAGDYAEEQRIIEGFQAGLKRGAEIANPIEGIIPRNQWMKGYQVGRQEAEQAILKEAGGE